MDQIETGATAPATPAGAPDAPVEAAPHALAALIEAWWDNHFPGSPVARVTEAYNHALAAKNALKRLIAKGE